VTVKTLKVKETQIKRRRDEVMDGEKWRMRVA
jgi:hypothetical protein